MGPLGVIGNISRDIAIYPDGRRHEMLGGAALHVARASSAAGLPAACVSVVGHDLAWIRSDPRLASIDLNAVRVTSEPSCEFRLSYDRDGTLSSIDCEFGAAGGLTDHALAMAGQYTCHHVCCRRPLDPARVLDRLVAAELAFSVDFHLASAAELIRAAAAALSCASVVFVNAAEFTTLATLIDPARLAAVVISDGPRDVTLLRHGRTAATAQPPRSAAVEVTGAGDTLAGSFLGGLARGAGADEALRTAVTAATQATRAPGLAIGTRR